MPVELDELLAQCVAVAKNAWWKNHKGQYHSGDHNRGSIGRLAAAIFKQASADLDPKDVREFLAGVKVQD